MKSAVYALGYLLGGVVGFWATGEIYADTIRHLHGQALGFFAGMGFNCGAAVGMAAAWAAIKFDAAIRCDAARCAGRKIGAR